MLANTAKTFSVRPSTLMGLDDPFLALDLDNACAVLLNRAEIQAAEDQADEMHREQWRRQALERLNG